MFILFDVVILFFNPFAPGDFAEKRILKLVEWFSGHCRAVALSCRGLSGREKRRDESFQAQAEKPLGTNSHQTKRSSKCWLLIGHKKCFVLLCPIDEQHLLSSFREFVHDHY